MAFEVRFKPTVQRDLRTIPPPMLARLIERIRALGNDPLARGAVKLSGSDHLYRVRLGDYRVIYDVNSSIKVVLIHYVRHRREVYRGL